MKKSESQFTDTTYRKYQNSNYEKTADGWIKKVEKAEETSQKPVKKEYSDEELAEYAKKASDESLRKAGSGRDERMRIAAKKEIARRRNEGMPEPEKSDNPFDEGMKKGLFDEFPIKTVLGKEYINKGQGWEILEKGKRASIGEVRTWSGEKYQRTKDGWKYLGKISGSTKLSEKKEAIGIADITEVNVGDEVEDYNGLKWTVDRVYHSLDNAKSAGEDVSELVSESWTGPVVVVNGTEGKNIVFGYGEEGAAKFKYAEKKEIKEPQVLKTSNPWPESVDKLTNRSSFDEIEDAAGEVAKEMFEQEFPTDEAKEEWYQKRIEEDKKYSWRTPTYPEQDEQAQKEWKQRERSAWISRKKSGLMGWGARTPISKTAKIANIKGAWKGIADRKEKAAAKAEKEAYAASEKGIKAAEEFKKNMEYRMDEFHKAKDEAKSSMISSIESNSSTIKNNPELKGKLEYSLSSDGLNIKGASGKWSDVEVYFRKPWGGERKYEVQTSAYGALQPDSPEVKAIQLQVDFMTNPQIIEATKSAVLKVEEAQKTYHTALEDLKNRYPNLEHDSLISSIKDSKSWD